MLEGQEKAYNKRAGDFNTALEEAHQRTDHPALSLVKLDHVIAARRCHWQREAKQLLYKTQRGSCASLNWCCVTPDPLLTCSVNRPPKNSCLDFTDVTWSDL